MLLTDLHAPGKNIGTILISSAVQEQPTARQPVDFESDFFHVMVSSLTH